MKTKNVIKHLVATLIGLTTAYLLTSFFTWDLDPSKWEEAVRGVTIFISAIAVGVFNGLAYHEVKI